VVACQSGFAAGLYGFQAEDVAVSVGAYADPAYQAALRHFGE
jgi:hypothetical protein